MFVCTTCGTVSKGKMLTKGSVLIELVLWLCFFVPGILYSLWRLGTRTRVCTACNGPMLVPATSPIGQQMLHAAAHRAHLPAPPASYQASP